MSIGLRLLLVAARGGGQFTPPPAPTIVAQSGPRETLFSGGNIYTNGLVYREGVLHLFTTEGTTEHAPGSAVKMRTSSDLGVTWSSAATVYSGGGAGRHGNIEAAFLTSSGRILLALDDQADADAFDVKGMVSYSDDGGATWSTPYEVPNSFSGDCVTGEFAKLPNGTIVMAIYGEQTGQFSGNTFSRVVFSADDGETFGSETTLAGSASRTYQEPNIAWVGGVELVALMRSDTNVHTWRSTSPDGDPWAAAADVLTASGPPDFLEWYGGGYLFTMLRNNNTQWRPRWATSLDRGATWTAVAEVDAGETRELDGTAMVMISPYLFITVYALANSSSSSTVYLRRWAIS